MKLTIQCVDGKMGQIDFADDVELAIKAISIALDTGTFPEIQWDNVSTVKNVSYAMPGPFKKMEIEFS